MRRAIRWAFVAWLLGEWWTRGGREMILGDSDGARGRDLDFFKLWVDLPPGTKLSDVRTGAPVHNPRGEVVGTILVGRLKPGVPFGAEIVQARGEFSRQHLGWPINVAMSEAEAYTRASVPERSSAA